MSILTALIILAVITAFLALICLIPISLKVRFAYDENSADAEIRLEYLFFKFVIYPKAEKSKKEKKKKKAADEEDGPKEESNKKNMLTMAKSIYRDVFDAAGNVLSYIDRHRITVDRLNVSAHFGFEDSALTGMAAGAANAFIYNTVGWISRHTKLGRYKVYIEPDFDRELIQAGIYCVFKANAAKITALCMFLLKEVLKVAAKLIKIKKGMKSQ